MNSRRTLREKICGYALKKYGSEPEYLWLRFPGYCVFRRGDCRKWYAIIMDVPEKSLGLDGGERVDILNVKLGDALLAEELMQRKGFFRGWHTGRGNWISILLDGTVPFKKICSLIDVSFCAVARTKKKVRFRPPKEWIVPANPKYYDIGHAFDHKDVIDWKQGRGIMTGDTVFLYAVAPVSSILFQCTVEQTDIPFSYAEGDLTITALMKLRLVKRCSPERFTFDILKGEYGIFSVRGPRGVPPRLSAALKDD